MHTINVTVNNELEIVEVSSNMTLLRMLREMLGLTGTKNGCSSGECGACTVVLNGEVVNSCMVLAIECEDAEIITVEGLAQDGQLDKIQLAMMEKGGVQCGFCTPGVLMTVWALLRRNPNPTRSEIQEMLSGNFCRCTGYKRIIDSVEHAVRV
jgi:carbon-monoxide dehydrogenase small subunit